MPGAPRRGPGDGASSHPHHAGSTDRCTLASECADRGAARWPGAAVHVRSQPGLVSNRPGGSMERVMGIEPTLVAWEGPSPAQSNNVPPLASR